MNWEACELFSPRKCRSNHDYKIPTRILWIEKVFIMPRLPRESRDQAMGMLMAGMSEAAVARHFGVARSTVNRLRKRHYQTGSTRDRPRPGRPRVTTAAQDRYIRLTHLRKKFQTAVETAAQTVGRHGRLIHPRTIRRRLRESGLRPYRTCVRVLLKERHRRIRQQWSRAHSNRNRDWHNERWRSVVFSDESRFLLFFHDGRCRVYRRRGERYCDPCIFQKKSFGGGGVMVWAAIRHGWKSELVFINGNLTAQRYIDNVLAPQIVPHFAENPLLTFMHDNARPHTARASQQFLHEHNVEVLPWPPVSPDLNPIEHVWDMLGKRIRRRNVQPRSLNQLRNALLEEWENIPQNAINALVTSMPRRIAAVSAARGGHTRY